MIERPAVLRAGLASGLATSTLVVRTEATPTFFFTCGVCSAKASGARQTKEIATKRGFMAFLMGSIDTYFIDPFEPKVGKRLVKNATVPPIMLAI
ncbi:MAG: hypothetical protein QM715_11345 [Nibricoccus sp.]